MTTDSAPTPPDASEPTTAASQAAGPSSAPSASSADAAASPAPAGAGTIEDPADPAETDRADHASSLAATPITPATPDEAARTPVAAGSPATAPPEATASAASHTSPGRVAPASQAPNINRQSLFARAEQNVSASAPTAGSADAPPADQEASAHSTAGAAGTASTSGVGEESSQVLATDPETSAPTGPVTFTSAWAQAQQEERPARPARSEEEIILDGSVTMSRPASRLRAHLLGVALSLTLIPFAWFFLHDAASGLITASSPSFPADPGEAFRFALDATALAELGVGLAALMVALWTARRSSVGAITAGVVSLVAGLPFLVAPTLMSLHVTPTLQATAGQSSLNHDLVTYVWADAASGRFVVGGLLLIMIGVISHSARRAGRREQEIRDRAPRDG